MDLRKLGRAEIARLRMAATLALYRCCDECRAVLREQLRREEWHEAD
jgi:hypothetical protein